MGVKINAQLNENREYVQAVKDFLELLMEKYFSFLKRINCYYKLTNDYVREEKSLKILNEMTKRVIENRKKERANMKHSNNTNEAEQEFGIKKKVALLDLLLNLKDDDSFTDQELCDEVNSFFFAVTLSFNRVKI